MLTLRSSGMVAIVPAPWLYVIRTEMKSWGVRPRQRRLNF
jgi:hypothetical protein